MRQLRQSTERTERRSPTRRRCSGRKRRWKIEDGCVVAHASQRAGALGILPKCCVNQNREQGCSHNPQAGMPALRGTLNIQHRTLNIQHSTSNAQLPRGGCKCGMRSAERGVARASQRAGDLGILPKSCMNQNWEQGCSFNPQAGMPALRGTRSAERLRTAGGEGRRLKIEDGCVVAHASQRASALGILPKSCVNQNWEQGCSHNPQAGMPALRQTDAAAQRPYLEPCRNVEPLNLEHPTFNIQRPTSKVGRRASPTGRRSTTSLPTGI